MKTRLLQNKDSRIEELETRLAEAEQLIEAIKAGEVDAFAIVNNNTREVFTLQTGDYAYRVLVEKFNEGALNLTEDGLIVYTNDYFHKFMGLPYEKIVSTNIFEHIAVDSKEKFQRLFKDALNGHSKGEVNMMVNGRPIAVYVSLTSLQPNLATVGMIVTNLTEKKTNEKLISNYQNELVAKNKMLLNKNKELEEEILREFSESFSGYKTGEDFFNSITQSLADKTKMDYAFIGELIKIDKNYSIRTIALNAYGQLTDNMEYPLTGGPCEEVVFGKVYTHPEHCHQLFSKNKLVIKFKIEGYAGYPLFDSEKKPIGLIAVMHEKKIEDTGYIESFLKIAARRTEIEMERIRNEKMLAAKNAELQYQNAELASFSYIASHDLQEPLRKIQAFISRILQKEKNQLSDTGKDYFTRIRNAAERMQQLIEALLSYSRTNTLDLEFETTDLNDILEEVKKDLQFEIHEEHVIIQSDPLPVLNIVPLQFQQLFSNIISNAIKYRKPGIQTRINITTDVVDYTEIKSVTVPLKNKYWKISITDNGIGFSPEHENRIFELFQRLHGKSEYEGTGIGLAICKKIMQNHQGFITATGIPGEGASFNIYLPVNE
jgi:PAS domain S-box-containing protein